MKSRSFQRTGWTRIFPPSAWLAEYKQSWLRHDAIAGVTLAAYAIPVSLAYAGLAGLPPQVGIYGYMLGGLGYALLGSSRQLAVGPTSAISLMIAGSVGALAGGDAIRFAQIASLSAFAVAVLCLIAWLFKLSILIRLVSDSILVGFKAGAGLTIIMSQLPSLFGVAGGGHNFFDRAIRLAGQVGDVNLLVLAIGARSDRALAPGRTISDGQAGRTCRGGVINPHGNPVRPSGIGRACHRKHPGGIAGFRDAHFRNAGIPGVISSSGRMPAAGLYRRCFGGAEFCREAWIQPGCPAGISGAGGCQPRRCVWPWLSRGRRIVAVRRQRHGGSALAFGIGVLLVCPRALPAFLHGIADQPSQDGAGWYRLCRRLQVGRRPRACFACGG